MAHQKSELEEMIAASESGVAQEQFVLAGSYLFGNGVSRDPEKAVNWFRKAAEQGHVDAQFQLGDLYSNGTAVRKDAAQAVHWFLKAAENGHAGAQFSLATCYQMGDGVPQDGVVAYMWLCIAVANGSPHAGEVMQYAERGLTSSQTNEGRRMANEWQAKRKLNTSHV
jgi:hypothetical protein